MNEMKGVVSIQKAKVGLDHLLMQQWETNQRQRQREQEAGPSKERQLPSPGRRRDTGIGSAGMAGVSTRV
jgi:hypothetical protein